MKERDRKLMRPAVIVARELGDAVERQNHELRELNHQYDRLRVKLSVHRLLEATRR